MDVMELTETDLAREATHLLDSFTPSKGARVIALYGDLGAGKTTFVKALAGALGITETVTSPTFVIEKIYKLEGRQFDHLIHIDAYRLSGSAELQTLGWDSIISNPKNLIVVEWADIIEEALPKDAIRIHFTVTGEMTRDITIETSTI